MNKAVIIGAGWLGIPLSTILQAKGWDVTVTTTKEEKKKVFEASGLRCFIVQLKEGVWDIESGFWNQVANADAVFYCIPPGTKKNPNSTHATDVESLLNLCPKESQATWIYAGSTAVYPDVPEVMDETWDTISFPGNHVIAQAETVIQQSGLPYLITRLGGLCGPGRMLAKFFSGRQDIAQGMYPVNLVHLDDVIGAYLFLLENNVVNIVVNIVSPDHPTKKDFYTYLCVNNLMQLPEFAADDSEGKSIQSSKLEDMGYQFKYSTPYEFTY
ncbi:MAG: NAD-dependent epimerase/dehydratase family protein [Cytophagaceae bacterium]